MKVLSRSLLYLCMVGALLLSACGKEAPTSTPKNNAESSNQTSQTPSANATQQSQPKSPNNSQPDSETLIDPATKEIKDITEADFKQGIFIDFKQFAKSFFNNDIISKLKENLQAVVAQDKEEFGKYLQEGGYSVETVFFSEKGIQFMFYDLDSLKKVSVDGIERIEVGIRYATKVPDGHIQNQGISYSFTKDNEGEWSIANID